MAFSKFEPHRAVEESDFESASAARRAWLLTWGWRISAVYTAIGFGFSVYWIATST